MQVEGASSLKISHEMGFPLLNALADNKKRVRSFCILITFVGALIASSTLLAVGVTTTKLGIGLLVGTCCLSSIATIAYLIFHKKARAPLSPALKSLKEKCENSEQLITGSILMGVVFPDPERICQHFSTLENSICNITDTMTSSNNEQLKFAYKRINQLLDEIYKVTQDRINRIELAVFDNRPSDNQRRVLYRVLQQAYRPSAQQNKKSEENPMERDMAELQPGTLLCKQLLERFWLAEDVANILPRDNEILCNFVLDVFNLCWCMILSSIPFKFKQPLEEEIPQNKVVLLPALRAVNGENFCVRAIYISLET